MIDKEKVIKSLLACRHNDSWWCRNECMYYREATEHAPEYCGKPALCKDAIALIEGQEGEWLPVDNTQNAFDCSLCDAMVSRKCLYCPGCGAKMKNGSRAMETTEWKDYINKIKNIEKDE